MEKETITAFIVGIALLVTAVLFWKRNLRRERENEAQLKKKKEETRKRKHDRQPKK